MATKKSAVKKVDAEGFKREAFRLYEEVMQYFKMRALNGELYPTDLIRAKAAFDVADVEVLRELVQDYKTDVKFTTPDNVLRRNLKRMKPIKLEDGKTRDFTMEDYTMADRIRILSGTPGTEMYAGLKLREAEKTPFDD